MKPFISLGVAALAWLASVASAQACDLFVMKTELPINHENYHINLCVGDYFAQRDLGRISVGEDPRDPSKIVLFRDQAAMTFDEMFLFQLPNQTSALGTPGRLAIDRQIYAAYLANLKNDLGACTLEIRSGDRLLTIDDFKASERSANDQPGSRLMLTKDDVPQPGWKLLCPAAGGGTKVEKSGDYFFIFIDTYEKVDPKLMGHLARYLFSFH